MVRAVRMLVVFSVGLILVTCNSFAQQRPHVAAPHKPTPPKLDKPIKELRVPTQRTMVGGLWMTDANWKSSLYLRNNVETDSIQVTPVLYLANGVKYQLAQLTIGPSENVTIDINDALQKRGISSWATLSGYVELDYNWAWDPFCATIRNIDTVHSLIFAYSLRPTMPTQIQIKHGHTAKVASAVEGMWWKQEKNVTGFVSVVNLAGEAAKTTLQTTDNQGQVLASHDFTISPHGMKFINVDELQSSTVAEGGLRIISSQSMEKLVVSGGLEDQAVGYSATIPFTAPQKLNLPDPPTQVEIAALGIMTGAADPMMAFPAGTTFTPYSVVRNASDAAVSLVPTLWWMEAGSPHSAPLPQITVPPHQTLSMDMPSLLAAFGPKNFNGSFNLVFDGNLGNSDVLMSAGSVDQTNTYVFETTPRGVAESASKSLQYWSIGNGDDTMITVWNPADEPQDFLLTLFYPGGQYALPLHLEARATRSLNISEIVQNQVPDANGNIIPAGTHEGGAVISGVHAENEQIMVAIDSGVYNVKKATCTNYCTNCDGYNNDELIINGFVLPVGSNTQEHLYAQYNSGGQYDFTNSSQWSSNATSVATVSAGLVNGAGAGAATISAVSGFVNIEEGYMCFGPNPIPCPQGKVSGSVNETGTPTVGIQDNGYVYIGHDAQVTQYLNAFFASGTPTGGTYQWSSTDSSISFDNSAASITHTTATSYSGGIDDTQISLKYTVNGQSAQTSVGVTKRLFYYLSGDLLTAITSYNGPNTYGYVYQASYSVYTHPDHAKVTDGSAISTSESVSITSSNVPFNPNYNQGSLDQNSLVQDTLKLLNSTQLPSNLSIVDSQDIAVGGIYVRTNTLSYTATGVSVSSQGPAN